MKVLFNTERWIIWSRLPQKNFCEHRSYGVLCTILRVASLYFLGNLILLKLTFCCHISSFWRRRWSILLKGATLWCCFKIPKGFSSVSWWFSIMCLCLLEYEDRKESVVKATTILTAMSELRELNFKEVGLMIGCKPLALQTLRLPILRVRVWKGLNSEGRFWMIQWYIFQSCLIQGN